MKIQKMLSTVGVVLSLLLGVCIVQAADGDLDLTFGGDGKVTTDFGSSYEYAYAMAIQSDGKLVVGGYFFNGSNFDFALARYNSNGTLDTTFGSGGKVTTPIGSGGDEARALALQSDGKIVLAGFSNNGSNNDFAVVRYNSNGSLDTSFGSGGKVTTPIGSIADQAYAIAIQSDGKIVVAGISHNGSDYDFAVVCYNSNGSLDTSFGSGGKVTTPIGVSEDYAYALALQSDGKIVVVGTKGGNPDFAVVRYNSNGSLDTSFGSGGKVTTPIGSIADQAYAIAIQSDGKIVVAGISVSSNYDFAVVRYNSNGSLDTSFGSGGKVTTPIGSAQDFVFALLIQSDGKLVAAGFSWNGSDEDFALVRYNSNGSLDTAFGSGGKVTTPIGSSDNRANALAIQSDGKIVVAGSATIGSTSDFALVRYQNAVNQVGPTLQVNVTNDNNGACTLDDCSLREAITAANAQAGSNTITFKSSLRGIIRLGSALPNISGNLTIVGPGANGLTVRPITNGAFNIFTINSGVNATLSGLTISNGYDGIFNYGTVTTTNCALSSNTAIGILNYGTVTATNCTLSSNTDTGLYNFGSATLTNCTLSSNFNGIYNFDAVTATNCTLSSNNIGIYNDGTTTINNTICAGNGTTNFAGSVAFTNGGSNLISGDPRLGPLADNGGPTPTMRLLPGSPVLDQGNSSLTTDQRGFKRPVDHSNLVNPRAGNGSDIGAFELETPFITITDAVKREGNSGSTVTAVFTVTLSTTSTRTVTVNFATEDISATAPADYTATTGTLTFAPGQSSKTIGMSVVGDTLDEENETFRVRLSTPTNAFIADSIGIGTIVDDDGPTISITDVSVAEGNPPQGAPGTTTAAAFVVTLSAASPQTITVKYATANGTAVAPADYTSKALSTLIFAPGETSKTLSVTVKGDNLDEPTESFSMRLSVPVNASLADGIGGCTILDDDAAPSIRISNHSLPEGNSGTTAMVFTVSLSAKSGKTVTVNFATADGTATADSDYASNGGQLIFAPGTLNQTITVQLNGDTAVEPNETFLVNLSGPVNATLLDNQGQGTILDDDSSRTAPESARAVESSSLALALVPRAGSHSGFEPLWICSLQDAKQF